MGRVVRRGDGRRWEGLSLVGEVEERVQRILGGQGRVGRGHPGQAEERSNDLAPSLPPEATGGTHSSSPESSELSSSPPLCCRPLCPRRWRCLAFFAALARDRLWSEMRAASRLCETTPMRRSKEWISSFSCCSAALILTSGEVSLRPESLDSKDSLRSSSFSLISASSLVFWLTTSLTPALFFSSSSSLCLIYSREGSEHDKDQDKDKDKAGLRT